MGIRTIARVLEITHPTIISWIKQMVTELPDSYEPEQVPQVGELDELETFIGCKKSKVWIGTAVDHFQPGVLGWVVGDHNAQTFQILWQAIVFWKCYFWVSDGNPGDNFAQAVKQICGEEVQVEVIKRKSKEFEVLPKRWIVERTFGWFNRFRRLSKDYELSTEFRTAMIYSSLIRLMTRRLAS